MCYQPFRISLFKGSISIPGSYLKVLSKQHHCENYKKNTDNLPNSIYLSMEVVSKFSIGLW